MEVTLVLTLLPLMVIMTEGAFIEKPTSQTVAENETAMFRCRIDIDAGVQIWVVNGSEVDSNGNPDFNQMSPSASDGGPPVHTLSIVARCVYSGTSVECFANDMELINGSGEVTLTIQGCCSTPTDGTSCPATDGSTETELPHTNQPEPTLISPTATSSSPYITLTPGITTTEEPTDESKNEKLFLVFIPVLVAVLLCIAGAIILGACCCKYKKPECLYADTAKKANTDTSEKENTDTTKKANTDTSEKDTIL